MSGVWPDAAAVVAVAVIVLVAVTTMALRRPVPAARPGQRRGMGVLAALPTWGGVLLAFALLVRGKFALGAIALIATVVHAGIMRARANAASRTRRR